ncbi:MAG: M20/M25/M40 family metallo-hydrolase [Bacteroidetes bacterium]|nr:M20/M25/M40 family metallo-hydrolase [Bacteroidota bacterium]
MMFFCLIVLVWEWCGGVDNFLGDKRTGGRADGRTGGRADRRTGGRVIYCIFGLSNFSMMRNLFLFILLFSFHLVVLPVSAQGGDSLLIRKIYSEALSNPEAYRNLDYLCNQVGGRLCGSPQAEKAVLWTKKVLDGMGLDTVYLQPVTVSHWERGKRETGKVISGKCGKKNLHICAIGGSVATPVNGITANLVEVKSFEELKMLGRSKIEGRIVFFNRSADPTPFYTFDAYGGSVDQRARGAMHAARYGATAVIVRSATPAHDDFPHTGNQHYADSVKAIPAFCISTNDADSLSGWLKTDAGLRVFLSSSCTLHPETVSYNVIGEIRGTKHPEEVILVGGHLDSWDIGQGAHDDGAGIVQCIDVLRLFKAMNIKPAHTVRMVAFMDEEYGQTGAGVYAGESKRRGDAGTEKHIAAIEADRGGTTPQGFSFDAPDAAMKRIAAWKPLLAPYGIWSFEKSGSGVDIRDLKSQGAILVALVTDSQRYFDYHHSANDTFDKVNARELELGAAAMTALVWLFDENW